MGIFGLAMMFAPAVGPTLSGWIIEHYTWRIMFYGLVPVGAIVIIVAFFIFKNLVEPQKSNSIHLERSSQLSDSHPYYTESVKRVLTAGLTRLSCLQL